MTNTNALTKSIVDWLNMSGHFVWRNNNAAVYDPTRKVFRSNSTKKGIADIIGAHRDNGKLIAIEVKVGKDRLTPEQVAFLNDVKQRGGISLVAKSIDDVITRADLR